MQLDAFFPREARQQNAKFRAAILFRMAKNTAPHFLYEGFTLIETNTDAFFFSSGERLKQSVVDEVGIHPGTIVFNQNIGAIAGEKPIPASKELP